MAMSNRDLPGSRPKPSNQSSIASSQWAVALLAFPALTQALSAQGTGVGVDSTVALAVRALEDGKAIVIEVADSGSGIHAEELPKIFEELYRGSNARGVEGSGLGLALVNRIVSLHGGQIIVRSRQENPRGTVFTVRLPEGR